MGNLIDREDDVEDIEPKDVLLRITESEFHEPLKDASIAEYRNEQDGERHEDGFLPDGKIDVNCTCWESGLAHRCGHLFRDVIVCYNSSKTTPKGLDCNETVKLCGRKSGVIIFPDSDTGLYPAPKKTLHFDGHCFWANRAFGTGKQHCKSEVMQMGNLLKRVSRDDGRNSAKDVLLRMNRIEYWTPLKDKSIASYLDEPNDEEREVGILPNGNINLDCPCLQSALAHRCGNLLRDAILCFNSSKTSPRGVDCDQYYALYFALRWTVNLPSRVPIQLIKHDSSKANSTECRKLSMLFIRFINRWPPPCPVDEVLLSSANFEDILNFSHFSGLNPSSCHLKKKREH
ncbi:unnamed protein product [Toxocara canis]|uniref:SWIM-type domain-containing protein n=1 Tax=Toxocara canis TaxID=6265 RepID=A0A183VBQ6_TOXCA|nr:unnamed protein product [Toxocara canis]